MIEYERKYWQQNNYVAGIDEAGRGPMAGPLVVAAVVLPIGYNNDAINDSKQLTEKKREALFDVIVDDAVDIYVEIINEKTIDRLNIYQATKEAIESLATRCKTDAVLVDAMSLDHHKEIVSIIKGDQKSITIASASIIAKVIRDHIMISYDAVYPEYGFKNHKGYPTKKHKEKLVECGVLNIHRRSYKPVYEALQPKFKL